MPEFSPVSEAPLEQAALDILGGAPARPHALHIAALVEQGFDEVHLHRAWLDLGNDKPIMSKTLGELDRILPYLPETTKAVARRYGKAPVRLFADRDGDIMHDHYVVTNPDDDKAHLMPASMYLLQSPSMLLRPGIALRFLAKYDITPDTLEAATEPLAIIDTGFVGRVRTALGDAIDRTYGYLPDTAKERIEIGLLCATGSPKKGVDQLIDVATTEYDEILHQFPRILDMTAGRPDSLDYYRPTFPIAASMQVMPRFHGAYMGLITKNNESIPITNPEPLSSDVDTMQGRSVDSGPVNYSIVNPLAAAIVQLRVVRHALQHRPGA